MSYFYFLLFSIFILLVFSLLLLLFACNGYRFSFWGVNLPGRDIEHSPLLAPWLRKCRPVRQLLLRAFMACSRVNFIYIYYFYIYHYLYRVYKNEIYVFMAPVLYVMWSPAMWHRIVWSVAANLVREHAASIFRRYRGMRLQCIGT